MDSLLSFVSSFTAVLFGASTSGLSVVLPGMAKGKLMRVAELLLDILVLSVVAGRFVSSASASVRVALALSVLRKKMLLNIAMLATNPNQCTFPVTRFREASLRESSLNRVDL